LWVFSHFSVFWWLSDQFLSIFMILLEPKFYGGFGGVNFNFRRLFLRLLFRVLKLPVIETPIIQLFCCRWIHFNFNRFNIQNCWPHLSIFIYILFLLNCEDFCSFVFAVFCRPKRKKKNSRQELTPFVGYFWKTIVIMAMKAPKTYFMVYLCPKFYEESNGPIFIFTRCLYIISISRFSSFFVHVYLQIIHFGSQLAQYAAKSNIITTKMSAFSMWTQRYQFHIHTLSFS
jgi:glycosyltransferase involved in cell wall biosynthesis